MVEVMISSCTSYQRKKTLHTCLNVFVFLQANKKDSPVTYPLKYADHEH